MAPIFRVVFICPDKPTDGTRFIREFVEELQGLYPDWKDQIAVEPRADQLAFQVTAEAHKELMDMVGGILAYVECHPGLCFPQRPGVDWWKLEFSGCFRKST